MRYEGNRFLESDCGRIPVGRIVLWTVVAMVLSGWIISVIRMEPLNPNRDHGFDERRDARDLYEREVTALESIDRSLKILSASVGTGPGRRGGK